MLKEQRLDDTVLEKLGLKAKPGDMQDWKKMVERMLAKNPEKTIAIVGKYAAVPDAYLSIFEAVKHAGATCGTSVKVKLVDCEQVERDGIKAIGKVDGIIVPGGFGSRGIEGKIAAVKYARENKIPYLGICLGMQMAVIEFARNVAGFNGANSVEINPSTDYPVIDLMESQKDVEIKGGTMRLGLYDCGLVKGTLVNKLYKSDNIKERHRHRYEFNNKYRGQLEKAGLVISGVNKALDLVETVEIANHPFFVGVQFHPELISRPYAPHPLFVGLVNAAKGGKK